VERGAIRQITTTLKEDFMDRFDNVSVIKKANVYFGGTVTSRTVLLAGGEKKTLGIMMPGEYEFGTGDKEIMEILAGDLTVLLPGGKDWKHVTAGQTFDVPANSKFKLKVSALTDYCCSYVKG
jgi:purine/pyrimidine-nucleoside phosphorylase